MSYRKTSRTRKTLGRTRRVPHFELLENRVLLAADAFEPNNSFAQASKLIGDDQTITDLTIHDNFNDDYYELTVQQDGTLTVDLLFKTLDGDLDLQLYDSNQSLLKVSDSITDNERASISVVAGRTYFIRVFGFNGALQDDYTMSIEGPGPGIAPDQFEPNDSFAAATDLGIGDQTHTRLTIHSTFNDDWYKWTAPDNGFLDVDVSFQHADGNIDLELYNSSQTLLVGSTSITDNERASVAVVSGQQYFVRVFGANGARNDDYSLSIVGPFFEVFPDRFEPNDSFVTASGLPNGDQIQNGLTIHLPNNDDWYAWPAPQSGTTTFAIDFNNAVGNLDLELYDTNSTLIARSNSTTNEEQITTSVSAGQTYVLRVFGVDGAISSDYDLSIDGPDLVPDRFEPNDRFGSPTDLGIGDVTIVGLSIHGGAIGFTPSVAETRTGSSSPSVNELQTVQMFPQGAANGGTFRLSINTVQTGNIQTAAIAFDASGPVVEAALDTAFGSNGFAVAGPAKGPYVIEFVGTLGGRDIGGLFQADVTNLMGSENSNPDYYKWSPSDDGKLTVDVLFSHSEGNVDVELLDAAQNVIARSNSLTDNERIETQVIAGQKYVIHVFGANGSVQRDYRLLVDGPLLGPDAFEPNDRFGDATDLGAGDQTHRGLTIHNSFNDDWYKWTSPDNGTVEVDIFFDHTIGDLEMEFYDASQNLLDESTSFGDSEHVEASAATGQMFVIHVFGFGNAIQRGYDLVINGPGADPDALEPNDSFATATNLGTGDRSETNLSIHSSRNDDWYKWTAAADGTLSVDVSFAHAGGNVDVELYDDTQTLIQSSTTTTDNEEILTTAGAGQMYFVRVFGAGGAIQDSYSLRIEGNDPPTISDIADVMTDEDVSTGPIAFTIGDQETAANLLQVNVTSSDPSVLAATGIVLGGADANRTVELTPELHRSGSTTVTVTVTDLDGAVATDSFVLTVTAKADTPTLTVSDALGNEDAAIPLNLSASLVDTDGSESLSIGITGVPVGASLSAGVNNGGGSWKLAPADLAGLSITPALHDDSDIALTVTATSAEGSNGDTANTIDTLSVTVNAVADAPQLAVSDASGNAASAIALSITSSLVDTDGSESLSVDIAGVPNSAVLSAGTNNGGGSWTLAPGELAGLTITPPAGNASDFSLTVTATATEGANNDSADSVGTIQVTVNAFNQPPVNSVPGMQATDENTSLVFSAANGNAISISDPDAGAADVGVILTVDDGQLDLATTNGLSSVVGDGTSGITLSGPIAAVNAAVNGLTYTPSADFSGMVTLSVVTNDLGNTGSGGQLTDTDMVAVIVNEVDVTPPTVTIVNVSPDTRAGAVDEIVIVFSEPVTGFEIGDLSLRRFTDTSVSLLPGSATLTTADNVTFTLGNLNGLTANSGIYTLTLPAAASGIVDQGSGLPLAQGASIQWVNGAGDANTDNEFNQFDIIAMLQAGLYLTNLPATWSTGDFDGNGRFDQFDIILANQTQPPHYLQGPFAAQSRSGSADAADAVFGQIGDGDARAADGVDAAVAQIRLI